jgi:hypothetical protein
MKAIEVICASSSDLVALLKHTTLRQLSCPLDYRPNSFYAVGETGAPKDCGRQAP